MTSFFYASRNDVLIQLRWVLRHVRNMSSRNLTDVRPASEHTNHIYIDWSEQVNMYTYQNIPPYI